MKKNLRLLTKQNKHWYSHEKNTKWAIQDKEGRWWLVNGSEFPEKKVKDDEMQCGLPPTFDFKKLLLRMVISGAAGILIGLVVGVIMIVVASL
jgi:hypothetical protein